MRNLQFQTGEYYHVYNRGVDKRTIFQDKKDLVRFHLSLQIFNGAQPIGSIYKNSLPKYQLISSASQSRLVEIVAYCLNPNHFHLILSPFVENGVQQFMQRLGTSYTKYFNEKHNRSGSLFQGRYKAKHILSNEYLLYLSVYINLNYKVHQYPEDALYKSSWREYIGENQVNFCSKSIVLQQYVSQETYKNDALALLPVLVQRKQDTKDFAALCIE